MLTISEETDLCPIVVETRDGPTYWRNVKVGPGGNFWFHDIKMFTANGSSYPDSTNLVEKRNEEISLSFLFKW